MRPAPGLSRRARLAHRKSGRCDSVRWSGVPHGAVPEAKPVLPGHRDHDACHQRYLVRREHCIGSRSGRAETIEPEVHGLPRPVRLRFLKHEIDPNGINGTSSDETPANGDPRECLVADGPEDGRWGLAGWRQLILSGISEENDALRQPCHVGAARDNRKSDNAGTAERDCPTNRGALLSRALTEGGS